MKCPVTPISVSTVNVTSRLLRWWRAPRRTVLVPSRGITIGGSTADAATVTAAAATVTSTTASRQPQSSLIAAVNGFPATIAGQVPTYTAVLARPACVAGTSLAPIGAITDHI